MADVTELTVDFLLIEKSAAERMKRLAHLGEMVLRLPWGMSLTNNGGEWCVEDPVCGHSWGATPEEAMRKFFESHHE